MTMLSSMTRSTIFTLCLLLLPGLVAAQDQADRRESAEARFEAQMDTLSARLSLTDEQEATVRPILREGLKARMERLQKFQAQNEDASRRAKRRAARNLRGDMKDIDQRTEEQLADHLSDSQMEEYRQYRDERREEMRERMRERRDG